MRLPIYFLPSSNSSRRQYQAAEAVGIDVLAAIKVGAFVSALRLLSLLSSPSLHLFIFITSLSLSRVLHLYYFVFLTSFYIGFLQGSSIF